MGTSLRRSLCCGKTASSSISILSFLPTLRGSSRKLSASTSVDRSQVIWSTLRRDRFTPSSPHQSRQTATPRLRLQRNSPRAGRQQRWYPLASACCFAKRGGLGMAALGNSLSHFNERARSRARTAGSRVGGDQHGQEHHRVNQRLHPDRDTAAGGAGSQGAGIYDSGAVTGSSWLPESSHPGDPNFHVHAFLCQVR